MPKLTFPRANTPDLGRSKSGQDWGANGGTQCPPLTQWGPMGPNGDQWCPMGPNGAQRGPKGAQWEPMGTNGYPMGIQWDPVGPNGIQWGHMGSNGGQWVSNGFQWVSHGIQWGPMGSNGDQWEFNGIQWGAKWDPVAANLNLSMGQIEYVEFVVKLLPAAGKWNLTNPGLFFPQLGPYRFQTNGLCV